MEVLPRSLRSGKTTRTPGVSRPKLAFLRRLDQIFLFMSANKEVLSLGTATVFVAEGACTQRALEDKNLERENQVVQRLLACPAQVKRLQVYFSDPHATDTENWPTLSVFSFKLKVPDCSVLKVDVLQTNSTAPSCFSGLQRFFF